MKKQKIAFVATGLLFLCTAFTSGAQENEEKKLHQSDSYKLEITSSKTSNIVFPFAIVSVDRGSKEILVQKAQGVENILQVKAASDSFPESNLSVVTADGKLTTFLVSYVEDPASLNLSVDPKNRANENSIFTPKEDVNESIVRKHAQLVMDSKDYYPGLKNDKNDIALYLKGIFIEDDVLYFRFNITNWSNVGYDVDQFRFFIRDQRKAKRTASQEIEVLPLYISKEPEKIPGKTMDTHVFALPKFTIPDKKYLAVQLMERDGGRHLTLKIKNRHIIGAKVINKK